jgi:predicted nucleic acid-binding protein
MPADRFLDTNILLYAYDLDAPDKRAVAKAILEEAFVQPASTALSVQVLQEFHVNFVRNGHPVAEATLIVGDFISWTVIENSLDLFQRGLWLQSRWKISLWDAMILAAAESSGARELLTEDLNHGQDYGAVRAINPFMSNFLAQT